MNRFGMAGAAVVLFLISWRQDDLSLLAFAAVVLMGTAIALQMRPSIAEIYSQRRLPEPGEIGILLAGLVLGYIGLGVLDGLLSAGHTLTARSYSSSDTTGRRVDAVVSTLITTVWTLLAVLPGLRAMLRREALWPVVVGIVASVPIAAGLYWMWSPFGDALRIGRSVLAHPVALAMALPLLGLLFAPGGLLWLRAWRGGPQLEPIGLLAASIRAVAIGWALTAAVAGLSLVTGRGDALVTTSFLLAIIAAAWVAGLWRLLGAEQCGLTRAGIGWLALVIGTGLSLILPAQTIETAAWAPLMLILGLPLLAGVVGIAVLLMPWFLRRLIRGAEPVHSFA